MRSRRRWSRRQKQQFVLLSLLAVGGAALAIWLCRQGDRIAARQLDLEALTAKPATPEETELSFHGGGPD